MTAIRIPALLLACLLVLPSCTSFNQASLDEMQRLKTKTVDLVDKATEPFADHQTEVAGLTKELNDAYKADLARTNNAAVIKQWEVLTVVNPNAPENGIVPRFFALWEKQGKISATSINGRNGRPGEKARISKAFDLLSATESAKKKQ